VLGFQHGNSTASPPLMIRSSLAMAVDAAPELDRDHADYADKRERRRALTARRKVT
jgi:hypothetical protein